MTLLINQNNTIILAIKPKFVELILAGTKKFEYRRVIWKNKNISNCLIYSSFPVKKIVGYFTIKNIIHDNIQKLWELDKEFSGLDKKQFLSYFQNKEKGYAIRIDKIFRFKEKYSLSSLNTSIPQNFMYLNSKFFHKLNFDNKNK